MYLSIEMLEVHRLDEDIRRWSVEFHQEDQLIE